MLRNRVPDFPEPPDGMDLLEWAKQCVANETVTVPGAAERAEAAAKRKEWQEEQAAELLEIAQELELPNAIEQVKNLWVHLRTIRKYKKRTGRVYVSGDHFDQRLAVCGRCDKVKKCDNGGLRCSICGCHLNKGIDLMGISAKPRYEAMHCEHPGGDKWQDIDTQYIRS